MRANLKSPTTKETLRPVVVLLVEDDEDYVVLFRRSFFQAVPNGLLSWVKNGLSAVQHFLENGPPDLVLTDLAMPVMSGFDLISWVRSDPAYPGIPVVVHTNSDDPEDRERAFALGATEYLVKNPSSEQLQDLLERLDLGPRRGAGDAKTGDLSLHP